MCCSVARFGGVPINTCSPHAHTRVYTQEPVQLYDVGDVYNRMWASAEPRLWLRVNPYSHVNKAEHGWHEAHPTGAEGLEANIQGIITVSL